MSCSRVNGFLVECYWPGVSETQIVALAARTHAAASQLPARREPVDLVESIVVPADETVFWLFEGREDDIRAVALEAGLTFERILEWRRVDGKTEREKQK
jgi:hypothetical protein